MKTKSQTTEYRPSRALLQDTIRMYDRSWSKLTSYLNSTTSPGEMTFTIHEVRIMLPAVLIFTGVFAISPLSKLILIVGFTLSVLNLITNYLKK